MFRTNSRTCFQVAALAVLAALAGAGAYAKDAELAIKDLPKNVVDAAMAAFPDAKILTAGQRSKHDKIVYYDIEVQNHSDTFDIYLDAESAAVLATGVTIPLKRLPSPVRDTISKDFYEFKMTEGERMTDYKTQKVTYSVEIVKGTKTLEIDLSPGGKIVKQEELDD